MLRWIKKKSLLNPAIITSLDELNKFKINFDIIAIGLFKDFANEYVSTYKNVSNSSSFEPILFTMSSNRELFSNFNIKQEQAVILYRKFNNDYAVLEGNFDKDKLTSFLKVNRLPDVVEFNHRVYTFIKVF